MIVLIYFTSCSAKAIIGHEDREQFSPYYNAFSEQLKSEMREYERLKNSLKAIKKIDWDYIAEVKAFESKDSSD